MRFSRLPGIAFKRHISRMKDRAPQPRVIEDCDHASSGWTAVYDDLIAHLRRLNVGESAPKPGDRFPDFALPDRGGRMRRLADLVANGPIVLTFNRGSWCSFCRDELEAWRARAGQLADKGLRLVSVSPETGGRSELLRTLAGPQAELLCDVDQGVALSAGLTFACSDALQRRYLDCGLDLADTYGGGGWLLPIPATFLIDRAATVRYAFTDPDFRVRAAPEAIFASLK